MLIPSPTLLSSASCFLPPRPPATCLRSTRPISLAIAVCICEQWRRLARSKPSQKVALSDFVFPAWRDSEAPDDGSVQMNFTNTVRAPFTLDHGGYFVKFDPSTDSQPQQVFGRRVAPWMRVLKSASRRVSKRIGK